MIRLLFTFLLAAGIQGAGAQKVMISGVEGDRPLQWADFTGKPDNNSTFFAYTAWKTKTRWGGVQFEGDKALIQSFELLLELDPVNSWHREDKKSDELLRHEQGHFDIGRLYMNEVVQNVKNASFTKSGYQAEIRKIITDANVKYHELNLKYDSETRHSMNKSEQEKWNTFFKTSLK